MSNKRLMVIIPDQLSDLIAKGEITERYYNPGNLFEEIHIVMINNDLVDPSAVQKTVGTARLFIHNLPAGKKVFFQSLGWRKSLLKTWALSGIELARQIDPCLIRCHGNLLNAYIAAQIKDNMGIPYIISLHNNPMTDRSLASSDWKEWLISRLSRSIEQYSLTNADIVLPVYKNIAPYLKKLGISNYEVAYNVLNIRHLSRKNDYNLHNPVKVLCVGRQIRSKNPENIIKAMRNLPGVQLTVIGDGPLHEYLKKVASEFKVDDRTVFVKSVPNDDLCRELPGYDIFVSHCDYWGIPKAVLEPLLTGLPVIINRRKGKPVDEFNGDFIYLVNNTEQGYFNALKKLIEDADYRAKLGEKAYVHANSLWAPGITEEKYVQIYKRFM